MAETWKMNQDTTVVSFSSLVLGDKTVKSYIFEKDKLKGITYFTLDKYVPELLSKFTQKNKIYQIETELFSKKDIWDGIELLKKENNVPPFVDGGEDADVAFYVLMAELSLYEIANYGETKGYKNIEAAKKKTDSVGTLYIYDYNDDTRIYITSGNVDGLAFVAYVPHYKDY